MRRLLLMITVAVMCFIPLTTFQEVDYHILAGALDAELFYHGEKDSKEISKMYNNLLFYESIFPDADVYTDGLKAKYDSLVN